jgi:hypothetical protein
VAATFDILAAAYAYGYSTIVGEMGLQWLVLSMIFFGAGLAVVATVGFYAVRYEHGLYLKVVRELSSTAHLAMWFQLRIQASWLRSTSQE